jgi:hypothetical protein
VTLVLLPLPSRPPARQDAPAPARRTAFR